MESLHSLHLFLTFSLVFCKQGNAINHSIGAGPQRNIIRKSAVLLRIGISTIRCRVVCTRKEGKFPRLNLSVHGGCSCHRFYPRCGVPLPIGRRIYSRSPSCSGKAWTRSYKGSLHGTEPGKGGHRSFSRLPILLSFSPTRSKEKESPE
jgi:hypothetical protein